MHFAQKDVILKGEPIGSVRGALREADLCEYADAVKSSWDALYVQLSAGHLNAGIEFLSGDRFVLYRETCSQRLHTVGALLPGMIAFGIPAGAAKEARWWGRPLPGGHLPFAHSACELDLVTEANEALTILSMAEDDFHQIFNQLTGLDSVHFLNGGRHLAVKPEAVLQLRAFWEQVLANTSVYDACNIGLADLVAPLLDTMALPRQVYCSSALKSSVLENVMNAAKRSDFKASVPELSLHLGISRRSIEYAFQGRLGVSPQGYFNLRRMGLCRRALHDANPGNTTVTAIVTQHGFYELGRFAANYQRQFGELPSESLRKTRCFVPVGVSPIRFSVG